MHRQEECNSQKRLVLVALRCRVETWVRPSGFLLAGRHSSGGHALDSDFFNVEETV